MSSWRDQILREFTPNVARLTVVADPDGLLLEEGILDGIRHRGFELIPFDDHIAFRYAYESSFRSRWDRGEQTDLVVVLRSQSDDLSTLPFDLLQAGRKLSFNLGDIFPSLSYPILVELDRADLDALYNAHSLHSPGPLGENATKDFILRHVFEVAPELIRETTDLLRVLLRRHYRGQKFPKALDGRIIQILNQRGQFTDWPLDTILSNREEFFGFLQERWPLFLDRISGSAEINGGGDFERVPLEYSGPTDLPFDHQDIKIYLDNLFAEGFLHSVPHLQSENLAHQWAAIGVKIDPSADRSLRRSMLIEDVSSGIPGTDARYGDWFLLARKWAELSVLAYDGTANSTEMQSITRLQGEIDGAFTEWLTRRYSGLVNLPSNPPVMVHHIPRFLARQRLETKNGKVALLVVDGLALDQWTLLREALASQRDTVQVRENLVFAWVPTLTSISRQALFSGKSPNFFPSSIHTTEKEPALWAQFWAEQGLKSNEIVYAKGLRGDGKNDDSLRLVENSITQGQVCVVGLVVDSVDRILHGMQLGTAGMHNQIRLWAQQTNVTSLVDTLIECGFRIFLTSDHGNVECKGCGRPSDGAAAEIRGERVRIFSNPKLRGGIHQQFPGSLEWPSYGLPDECFPLIAPSRRAFVQIAEGLISHGGISIEEVIVPFITIESKNQ